MERDVSRRCEVCEVLVGLGDVEVLEAVEREGEPLVVRVRLRGRPVCRGCGGGVWSKGWRDVGLVDLPVFAWAGVFGVAEAAVAVPFVGVRGGFVY